MLGIKMIYLALLLSATSPLKNGINYLSKAQFFSVYKQLAVKIQGMSNTSYYSVQYFEHKSNDSRVGVCNKYFTVRQIKRGDVHGLYECFKAAMEFVGVNDWEEKLLGLGCNGTNVSIAARGLRGYLEEAVPWDCCVLVFGSPS